MIAYANVSLTLDPQIREAAEKWWDEHAPDLFTFSGYHTAGIDHLPIPYPPMRRPPRPGVLVWPVGASRWAQFAAFATGAQVEAIRAAIGDPPSARTLFLGDDSGNEIRPQMWMLPARPCFQFGGGELYLLTFVDDRYRWWLKGDQSAPTATTWSALLSGLITSVAGSAPSVPAIPAAYGTPLTRWRVREKPIPLLIDAACTAVGLRLLVSRAGVLTLQDAATAITAEETQWNLYKSKLAFGGRKAVADIARSVPAAVTTVFSSDRGKASATATKTLASLALAEFGTAQGIPSTKAQVHGDLVAIAAASARTAYSEQAARDYYRWSLSRVDATFRMLQEWSLTGLEDRVEWELQDRRVLTRVIPADLNDRNIYGAIPELAASFKASSNCTSFLGSLKPGRCYRLTTPEPGDGSCSCMPTGQTADLSYEAARKAHTSSTLLYGCPPGVFTTLCPQPTGAPKKWNLPVSGLTGDFEHFNQNYTIAHSTGETWTAAKNGITVTAVQTTSGVWSLTLSDGTTTIAYAAEGVVGCCSAITFTLVDADGADDAPEELTLSPATSCGKGPAYTPVLDKCTTECMRNARLRWEPVAGSGARRILFDPPVCGVDANGNKYADFSTDDPLLCSGTEAAGCADNKFTVRITCVKCDCPWFTQPGWYCVNGACQYLEEPPEDCDSLTAGPFDAEADCGCLTADPSCECLEESPPSVCMTWELVEGADILGLAGTYPVPWHRFPNPSNPPDDRHGWWTSLVRTVGGSQATITIGAGGGAQPDRICDANGSPGIHPIGTQGWVEFSPPYSGHLVTAALEYTWPLDPMPDLGADEILFGTLGLCGVFENLAAGKSFVQFTGAALSLSGVGSDIVVYKTTIRSTTCSAPTPVTYVCLNGVCTAVYDGSGTTLANCLLACGGGVVTYNCVSGNCQAVAGLGGTYATLAACEAACVPGGLPWCGYYHPSFAGRPCYLVVTGGPLDGTYTALTDAAGAATFHFPSPHPSWTVGGAAGQPTKLTFAGSTADVTCGPPISCTFPGSDFFTGSPGEQFAGCTSIVFHT